jgi:hypothetical protein
VYGGCLIVEATDDPRRETIADCEGLDNGVDNAERIVACVNSLAGIPDPQAYVAAATRHEQALRLLQDCLDNLECDCIDPPEERDPDDERGTDHNDPSAHSQYCSHYTLAVIDAALNGKDFPA